jgi:HrpA-like RNA helicase
VNFALRSRIAGLDGPGICFRYCSKEDYATRRKTLIPEALLRDPLPMVLAALAFGVCGANGPQVPLLDCPSEDAWRRGVQTLSAMKVLRVEEGSVLAADARLAGDMAALPLEPRFAHMMLQCALPFHSVCSRGLPRLGAMYT